MNRAPATAKINLALVVGPRRSDGMHQLATVYQGLDFADRVSVEPAAKLRVSGFRGDTLVARALRLLSERAGVEPKFEVRIEKRIPVAAGLGGGSSDAATALRLANATLARPLAQSELEALARDVGSDVPFFLRPGPQLGRGDGTELTPLELPQDYWVVLVLSRAERKVSSAAVYGEFEDRGGAEGFDARLATLLESLERVRRARDLAALPANDLASSPLAAELLELGAFRADVTGAGPTVYGLFQHRPAAEEAVRVFSGRGRAWLTLPAWYV